MPCQMPADLFSKIGCWLLQESCEIEQHMPVAKIDQHEEGRVISAGKGIHMLLDVIALDQ